MNRTIKILNKALEKINEYRNNAYEGDTENLIDDLELALIRSLKRLEGNE